VYQPITAAEHIAQMAPTEDPWWLYAYSSMFASIREQRWDRATAEVEQLTGRAPQPLTGSLHE
jgi:NAD(P)H dehydrogenase (quinone)